MGAALQHGQSARLGSCASSGRAWRLRAARDAQGERPGHRAPRHRLRGSRVGRFQSPPTHQAPPPLSKQVLPDELPAALVPESKRGGLQAPYILYIPIGSRLHTP